MTFRRGRDPEGFQNYGGRASHRQSQLPSLPGETVMDQEAPRDVTYLVQCGTFTLQILPSTISNVFVVGSILKCDLHNCSDTDTISPRFGVHVQKVRLDLRHGRAPSIVTENLVGKSYDLPPFHVRQLWSPARGWSLGHVFRAKASVECRLYARSLREGRWSNAKNRRLCLREGIPNTCARRLWFREHAIINRVASRSADNFNASGHVYLNNHHVMSIPATPLSSHQVPGSPPASSWSLFIAWYGCRDLRRRITLRTAIPATVVWMIEMPLTP